jgi:hypothetical protein
MADGTGTQGTDRIFDRETLLDLTVNIIPLGIILFFVVLFLAFRPFGVDPVATVISMGLLVIPFAALAVLTYFAGKVITEAERYGESETAEDVAETAIGVGEGTPDGDGSDEDSEADGRTDHPSTAAGGTAAPAGAGTDRAQRTGSGDGKNGNGQEGAGPDAAEEAADDETESESE